MVTFELVITAAIVILAVVYVTVLFKLKPSNENQDDHKKNFVAEKRESPQDGLIFVDSLETKAKTTPPQKTQAQINSPKVRHPSTMTARPSAPQDKNQEIPKHVVKPENRPSNLHCAHYFGYLRTLPKNTPIPSECFGCLQVVDCMTTLKVEKKHVKSHVTNS